MEEAPDLEEVRQPEMEELAVLGEVRRPEMEEMAVLGEVRQPEMEEMADLREVLQLDREEEADLGWARQSEREKAANLGGVRQQDCVRAACGVPKVARFLSCKNASCPERQAFGRMYISSSGELVVALHLAPPQTKGKGLFVETEPLDHGA